MTDPLLTIRDARAADLPAIVAMLADDPMGAGRERFAEPLPPAYFAAFDEIESDPRQRLLVAERDDALVGTLQLSIIPNLTFGGRRRAQVEGVRIAGSARGQGVGRSLMEHAKGIAQDQGCHLLQLTTNRQRPEAVRFYERLGFVDSHHGLKLYLQSA
jgi:ribosomal protein S18 acetylase RimI-like enzyme